MKLTFILSFLLLFPLLAQGQDTTYFNAEWEEISTGDTASFYRVIAPFDDDDLFSIRDYYKSGQVQMDGTCYLRDTVIRHGKFTYYFENGDLEATVEYKKGKREGEYVQYNENGTLFVRARYKNGRHVGRWTYYYPDGTVRTDHEYKKDGTKVTYRIDEETLEPDIDGFYHILNIRAKFTHDGQTLKDYILPKLIIPEEAKENLDGIYNAGQYFLDEQGKVLRYKPYMRIGFGLDEQLESILTAMPNWEPGTLKGKPVPFKWMLVVEFEDGEIIDIRT